MRNFLFFWFVIFFLPTLVVKMSVKDHITKKLLFADAAVRFLFVYFVLLFAVYSCSQDVGERSYYEETAVCGCRCEISFRIFC